MTFEYRIFNSKEAEAGKTGPHFREQGSIQAALEEICNAWATYLGSYVEQTKELFGQSERPWEDTERPVVSTLSTAIARGFPMSLTLEECGVEKPGRSSNPKSSKSTDFGLCDLWAFIPELKTATKSFSFYLEAKESKAPKTIDGLLGYLSTDRGVSRLLNDYLKASPGKIRKRSPYSELNGRLHPHYVVGMLVMELDQRENDQPTADVFARIDGVLRGVFEKGHQVKVKSSSAGAESERYRRLGRYPTTALILAPFGEETGMIATFTVFGATKDLLANRNK